MKRKLKFFLHLDTLDLNIIKNDLFLTKTFENIDIEFLLLKKNINEILEEKYYRYIITFLLSRRVGEYNRL